MTWYFVYHATGNIYKAPDDELEPDQVAWLPGTGGLEDIGMLLPPCIFPMTVGSDRRKHNYDLAGFRVKCETRRKSVSALMTVCQ
jgi:hypothetical protein